MSYFAFSQTSEPINREPAVAGRFYAINPEQLKAELAGYFNKVKAIKRETRTTIAIISPHAGYVFSGEVAAAAVIQLEPNRNYDNIFLIGSSHHVGFDGASVYNQGNYITPLGTVKVNRELADNLIQSSSYINFYAQAHSQEHSLEVQLPFLQYYLNNDFNIVPIIIGTRDKRICKKLAADLAPYFNENNLFIISSDFSHYPTKSDAEIIDKLTADAIVENSPGKLLETIEFNKHEGIPNLATSLCGWSSVLTLLNLTKDNPDVLVEPVLYRNSADSRFGDDQRVVGYYAMRFSIPEKKNDEALNTDFTLSNTDKDILLQLSRNTLEKVVRGDSYPEINTDNLNCRLATKCGAFVTLHKNGELRGCIGRFGESTELYKLVMEMTKAAALSDYRFPSVQPDELSEIKIEISVLTPMKKINSIDEIQLGTHGIYIKQGSSSGTFLPKVAESTGWTKKELLGNCAKNKARIGWDGWKTADIFIYKALVFNEI